MKKLSRIIIVITLFFLTFSVSLAEDIDLDVKVLRIDTPTLQKGYTIEGFEGRLRVGIFPEVLAVETDVALKDFYNPEEILPIPADKKPVSHIYEFDISNKTAFHDEKPVIIEIKYDSDYVGFRSIYYFDKGKSSWIKIPSYDITGSKKMRANLHLPYARLAVLEDRGAMETGTASWYSWKDCDCAASPDYPKGTRLSVTNLDNGKSVVVTVNDYGPERDKFPNRVIDLDKEAFSKIANPASGLCNVRVVPFKEKEEEVGLLIKEEGKVLGETASSEDLVLEENIPFALDAEAAIVVDAKTGEILYEKNGEKELPIASITKLMTAKVVLDLEPDWNKVMEYSKYDDDVTDYAGKWEMSYLYVDPGETLTINDLFYSALVGSANNATYALYRSTGLIRSHFVEVMNRKAKELGMANSHFSEPSGLDPKNTSTVRDLAKLGRKAFGSLKVLQATTSKKYSFSTINTNEAHTISNKNKLLSRDLYILGTKTGYLYEAGKCIMAKAKNDFGDEVIIVTLGNFSENRDDYFDEAEQLINWGLDELEGGE